MKKHDLIVKKNKKYRVLLNENKSYEANKILGVRKTEILDFPDNGFDSVPIFIFYF